MRIRAVDKILALALTCVVAFTSLPVLTGQTVAEAAAGDTVSVTYQVQVYQDDVSTVFDSIKHDEGVTINYSQALERLAVQRAEDLALFYDSTRPDGHSGSLITETGTTGDTSSMDGQMIADNTPSWDLSSTSYRTAGIGHVKFNNKDYYCLALSDTATEASEEPDKSQTGYSTVTRDIASANIAGRYAIYNFNDGSGNSGNTVFSNGAATCDKTISVPLGGRRQVPAVTYGIRTTSASDYMFPVNGVTASLQTTNDTYASTSGEYVTGKAVGNSSVRFTADIAGESTTYTVPVTVTAADISSGVMTLVSSETLYATGKAIEPDVRLEVGGKTLRKDTDYTLSYTGNSPALTITSAQTATVTATGRGDYTGTRALNFQIQPNNGGNLSEATIAVTESNLLYDGKEKKPKATVTLHGITVPESEYDLSYSNNTNAGRASIRATAKSTSTKYSGTATGTFDIGAADLSGATFTFTNTVNNSSTSPQYAYTGADIKPEPDVKVGSNTLKKGTDFTYSYSNNRAIGTGATVTVTGTKNYSGTASASFEIVRGDISKATVTLTPASPYTYNGQRQYPSVVTVQMGTNTLTQGTDYTISAFPDSVNAGTYNFTITGINNFAATTSTSTTASNTSSSSSSSSAGTAGTLSVSYEIKAKDAEALNGKDNGISVTNISTKTYTGKAIKPSVEVIDEGIGQVLTADTDYTRSDSNNTNPGTASVTLTFKGNYSGTITVNYKIVPKKTSISKVTAGKRKATVKYKKISRVSGYQVKSGTNRAVTKGTKTKNTTKTSYTMTSLKKGKRYYFKVRTYFNASNGKKVYSSWSNVKSVKVK